MDCTDPAPRVNFEYLPRFVGKKVRLVGQCEGFDGGVAKVKAADGGIVLVKTKAGAPYETSFVEVEGLVDGPTSMTEAEHTPFGENFDLEVYNEVCKLANTSQQSLFL
eukprot:jgi/Pico_ML_1/53339/g3903.t1